MSRLLSLKSDKIEVGILPDLGGRVVLLRLRGFENVLKADSSIWNSPPVIKTSFSPEARWKAHYGHIVWLGPQSEWWLHQNKSQRRLKRKAFWPPDPYLCFGNYNILDQTEKSLLVQGPPSEFTGVQLTKSLHIDEFDRVVFRVRAKNIRNEPISWDLWMNTRLDGYARCYVPVKDCSKIRLTGRQTSTQDSSSFSHEEGLFCLNPLPPMEGKKCRWAKAFIPADLGFMAAFTRSQAFLIHFKSYPENMIHPEHSIVEMYNYTNHSAADALNELEYHSPYTTLMPEETMESEQVWELHEFACQEKSHLPYIEFLKKRTETLQHSLALSST